MRIVFTKSATKHGLDVAQIAFAMANALSIDRGHRGPVDPDLGPVDLFIGATPQGVVIEVLAERSDDGTVVVFHAMTIGRRRAQQLDELMRRNRRRGWGR